MPVSKKANPDVRPQIVEWAKYLVSIKNHFLYEQIRPMPLSIDKWPIKTDCSGFATLVYRLAGAPDPNGPKYHYNGRGYTGTLLANGKKITREQARPGDMIVYGPGTGWHVAVIVEAGANPLTVSMGQNGDPSYVHVNEDGRTPQTYLTFSTIQSWPATPLPHRA